MTGKRQTANVVDVDVVVDVVVVVIVIDDVVVDVVVVDVVVIVVVDVDVVVVVMAVFGQSILPSLNTANDILLALF